MNQKFKIGDRVTTKKIWLPITGTIAACMTPLVHNVMLYNKEDIEMDRWTQFCDWKNYPVYFIQLDEPSYHLTFNKFCEQCPKCMHNIEIYQYLIPKSHNVIHPEEDIELLKENG
jgi:hypothetical protein